MLLRPILVTAVLRCRKLRLHKLAQGSKEDEAQGAVSEGVIALWTMESDEKQQRLEVRRRTTEARQSARTDGICQSFPSTRLGRRRDQALSGMMIGSHSKKPENHRSVEMVKIW